MPRFIVRGQEISAVKIWQAGQLRRAMTPQERLLWQALRRSQLGAHFRRQQVIDGFIADFYCHRAALVVEVDGIAPRAKKDLDAERDRAFAELGLTVLRVTNQEVDKALDEVLERIRRRLI